MTEPHRSILFDLPENDAGADGEEEPAFLADLNLRQVVEEVVKGREEYQLRTFFYAPLPDAAAVVYRQEVARDLEQPAVFASIESFAGKMRTMREHLAQAFHREGMDTALFLRAERQADGARTYRIVEGRPRSTSCGEDVYRRIFGADARSV